MKAALQNWKGETTGEIEIPKEVFGAPWRPALVQQALLAQLANRRDPIAHAKTRGEVRGGGKKPWRQKGTGRARHGSIRSPLWVGGGKAHGPSSLRDYGQKLNKKMRYRALTSILSKKFGEGQVRIFDTLETDSWKTKQLWHSLHAALKTEKGRKRMDVLLVPRAESKNLFRAGANLEKTKVLSPESLNVYDLLNHRYVCIDQRSIPALIRK